MSDKIRKPAVAGMFYPENPNDLLNTTTTLLTENKPQNKYEEILGIVAPHAGYIYSGKSAAFAYNVIKEKGDFKNAIVISPSHYAYFQGSSIYDGDYYETPLGKVPVNKTLSEKIIAESKNVFFSEKGHGEEHALEVQLPFLQTINKNFSLVPIVIGDQSSLYIQDLSKALSKVMDDSTIIVVSSDLSHFHSRTIAQKIDNKVIERINDFDFPELYSDLASGNCEACGGGGIVALMEVADIIGDYKAEVLSYTDSGMVTGDTASVVGYLSAVIYK